MRRIIIAYEAREDFLTTNASRFMSALLPVSDSSIPVNQFKHHVFGAGTQDLDAPWSLGGMIQHIQGFNQLICNIISGYQFIMYNYEPGDEIFIFGSSRGAFTARVVANFIARFSVLAVLDSGSLEPALRAYKDGHLDSYASGCEVISGSADVLSEKPRVYKVEIEVVGCWDTVSSLGSAPWNLGTNPGGVSGEYQHLDAGLAKGIKRVFHALALDECRDSFTPMLWHLPRDLDPDSIVLRQCWFPGTHKNVGGGYPDRALSNLSLAWMINQCQGLLDFDQRYLDDIICFDHNPRRSIWDWKSFQEDKYRKDNFDLHYQGWGRGRWCDSYKQGHTWAWKYRTPGTYSFGGETRETIHASVRERWESSREPGRGLTTGPPVYEPMALKGFELRKDGDSDRWEWVRQLNGTTDLAIPEFPFPKIGVGVGESQSSLEWRLRYENGS